MIAALVLSLMATTAEPMALPVYANTDPAMAEAVWSILEAQDEAGFTQLLAAENDLVLDRVIAAPSVASFADVAAECDPAEPFSWTNGVLGPVASFEAKLTCLDPEGRQKTARINIDGEGKVVSIEIARPIVFKF